MEDKSTLKKVVMVHGQGVELHSLDGEIWGTDLAQLQQRMEQREKEQARILNEAKKYLKGRAGLSKKSPL
jgi:hypothetical protein